MFDRDSILRRVTGSEDRLFASRLLDKVTKVLKSGCEVHTDFLDPYQKSVAARIFSGMENMDFRFSGGYEGAERVIAILRPDFMPFLDTPDISGIVSVIKLSYQAGELSHRDFLGSVVGLGIKREKTGDILLGQNICHIIVLEEIAGFISENLLRVGNVSVSAEIEELESLPAPERKVKEIRATVASLRLDCVAGAGLGLSRTSAAEYIKAGKLSLNWEATDNPSKQVKQGDTISIRGRGKIVLDSVTGLTKKERIGILIKKYI